MPSDLSSQDQKLVPDDRNDRHEGARRLDPLRALAVTAGKASALSSRILGKGGGTTLPGLVATTIHPPVVRELSNQLASGCVLITGTNGKTTTSRITARILSDAGLEALRNAAGSNLERGIAASLIREADLLGNLRSKQNRLGIFEVDEAALPPMLATLQPRTVVLLDLFRDQLDRYGEVATVARIWAEGIRQLEPDVQLIANADDPLVAHVARSFPGTPFFFGIEGASREATSREHASDVKACPACGGRIEYSAMFLGHLGHYHCASCGFARPQVDLKATKVTLHGVDGSDMELSVDGSPTQLKLPLPGMYNVYNSLAAASLAATLQIPLKAIADSISRVTPAFGRMERVRIEGRDVILALAKNPTGMNEVLRTIGESGGKLHLLAMLNDNIADSRDVSWIWDADFEMLRGRVASVVFGGIRAEDIALRFKYAGVIGEELQNWGVERETEKAFTRALAATPAGDWLFIVPTYTAMLDVRNTLTRLGHVSAYWEE